MSNITFSFDDELIGAAKALAARQGTSVNALVRSALEHQVAIAGSTYSGAAISGVIAALLDYSSGRRPRAAVMAELGLQDYGALLRLLNATGLPHPFLPLSRREQMAVGLSKLLQGGAEPQRIRIVLPDTGPLISLAMGEALDLLLLAKRDVRIVLTDIVHFEVTCRHKDFADGAAILSFVDAHRDRVEIAPTTIGQFALPALRDRLGSGDPASLPKDLGELSITSFITSMRETNPGDPTLMIIEDDWFQNNVYQSPGNVHLLSTAAFLDGLQRAGMIESCAAIRARIQSKRQGFRADWMVDHPAEKIEVGTAGIPGFRG